jgi:adenylate cyclase
MPSPIMFWRLFTPLRLALLIGLALSVLRFQGCLYLSLTDIRAMDYRLLQRGVLKPGPEVAIVAVDDGSVAKIGRWPWPRSILAKLVDEVAAADPAVIGFDIVFSESSEFPEKNGFSARPENLDPKTWDTVQAAMKDQDASLVGALKRSDRAVLGYFFDFEGPRDPNMSSHVSMYNVVQGSATGRSRVPMGRAMRPNLPPFNAAAREVGYFNVIPDKNDGSIRRAPLAVRYGKDMAIPLSLAMLRVYRPSWPLVIRFGDFGVDSVRVGKIDVPVDENGQLVINYRGPGRTFPHYPAEDVLAGKVPAETFRGKMVLIGITATAVQDIRVTPFDVVCPGVEIHANVIDNILRGDFISQPNWLVLVDIAALLALTLTIGLAMRYTRGAGAAALVVALLALYLIGTQWLFVTYGLPLTIVYALLAIALTYASIAMQHYMTEEREKKKTRKALDLYLSPSMAKLVSDQPERLKLGGEKRELTVFFSDIRGFTSFAERLQPEDLVELLNVYLGNMTDIIFEYDGMLDKYIGDAVMAVWGAPLPQEDHARRACRATMKMLSRLESLNEEWQERGWPRLSVGIGLNTGPMVFGNMGSAKHLSLTVMGDNVNLGSRLEGLNKLYGTHAIATESTLRAAGDVVVARELDLVRVKGKLEAVRIFEMLGVNGDRARWALLLERFNAGIEAYRQRRWEGARAVFRAILEENPDDGPSRLYLARCQAMLATPPPPDWDGVTVMETK